MLVFWIVLLRDVAAFCAAEKTDEKKPPPGAGVPGLLAGPVSGMGVKGAFVMFESLLGPILPDPDLPLLWAIMLPWAAPPIVSVEAFAAASTTVCEPGPGEECAKGALWSVGVGGVLTMTGVPFSGLGGVEGTTEVSILVELMVEALERCRSGE